MSQTEYHSGTITPVKIIDNLETTAKMILAEKGVVFEEAENRTALEMLRDSYYDQYTVIDGVLYKIDSLELDGDADIYNATPNGDGSFKFEVRFYNGGCCMAEAIEIALKKYHKSA